MTIKTIGRRQRWIPTVLAAAAIALGAGGLIDPALAGAAPPVTTAPAPPPVQGSAPAPAKRAPAPKQVLCAVTEADGSIGFYLPGEVWTQQGGDHYICGADGNWHSVW